MDIVPATNLLTMENVKPCSDATGVTHELHECTGCHKIIRDKFLLKALDHYYHEDCLKCSCCDCRLGEVGNTLFSKANLIMCRRDYLR